MYFSLGIFEQYNNFFWRDLDWDTNTARSYYRHVLQIHRGNYIFSIIYLLSQPELFSVFEVLGIYI